MATLSLSNLGVGAESSLSPAPRQVGAVQRVAFEDALARKEADPAAAVETARPVAETSPSPVAQDGRVGLDGGIGARDRVRRSLELGAAPGVSDGDTILKGLQKMRGTFDQRHARINEIMSGGAVDTNALLAMQMEVAQYSLLVEVSSKLTGKTTQSLDTLMKGQ